MGTAVSSNIQVKMFTVTYRLDSSNHPRILHCPTYVCICVPKKKISVDSSLFCILEVVEIRMQLTTVFMYHNQHTHCQLMEGKAGQT